MILYHFTRPELLPSILQEGLLVSKATEKNDAFGKKAIYFTAVPSLVASLADRLFALQLGILILPGGNFCAWQFNSVPSCCDPNS